MTNATPCPVCRTPTLAMVTVDGLGHDQRSAVLAHLTQPPAD